MNAHLPKPGEVQAQCLRELREHTAEMMNLAGHYCSLAEQFAWLGDDGGLAYAIRAQVAYTRAAVGTFNQLSEGLAVAEFSEGAI